MSDDTTALRHLGWDDALAAALARVAGRGAPGRVTRVDRGGWLTVRTAQGHSRARLHPRFRRTADPLGRPTVGDWVLLPPDPHGEAVVEDVLPRRSVIVRNTGGDERDVLQALAANVDTAFLALPLDGDRNPRRTDRFITLVRSGGVEPVLLLTKADRVGAREADRAGDEAQGHGLPVHVVSARTGAGLSALAPYLRVGCTVVLLGVSGAGKSTLVNRLLGRSVLETAPVRRDGAGRHTTTHRALLQLPDGALLVDTPGLRSVAAWDQGAESAFADVAALARGCRFADCAHEREPGCAVQAALERGQLDPARWDSYRRLRDEQDALAARRRSGRRPRRGGR